mgnify:CR=1 FL=1
MREAAEKAKGKTGMERLDVFLEYGEKLSAGDYASCYKDFISVLVDVVYLMFGSQAKKEDFAEYALRIDPEFGIFWWYLHSLPKERAWGNEKCRIVILLGMYFLANY